MTAVTQLDASLKHQMELLHEQQQRKLERRKAREKGRADEKEKSNSKAAKSFGISDDLDLKLQQISVKPESLYSEEMVSRLREQIRELKDETGRLCKLLAERELDLRSLKRKVTADTGDPATKGLTNETAATRIVDLSRKLREMTSELERERTNGKQLTRRCLDLQNEMVNGSSKDTGGKKAANGMSSFSCTPSGDTAELNDTAAVMKSLQEKVRQAELKVIEHRNQIQSLRQELKLTHKVLASEVGDGVTPISLINTPGGWRGRAQQIVILQKKVNELKRSQNDQPVTNRSEVDAADDDDLMTSASSRRTTAIERNKGQLWKVEKERRETQQRTANELRALEADYETLQQKLDAAKARNTVLQNEAKMNKHQLQTLLEKGQHDDELIQALFKQQSQLNVSLAASSATAAAAEQQREEMRSQLAQLVQQQEASSKQLRQVVESKERRVKELEWRLGQQESREMSPPVETGSRLSAQSRSGIDEPTVAWERDDSTLSCASGGRGQQSRSSSAASRSQRSGKRHSPTSRENRAAEAIVAHTVTVGGMKPVVAPTIAAGGPETDWQLQCEEQRLLCQTSEVERDKLAELVQLLQERLDGAAQSSRDAQNELAMQKRRNALLEKQLGRAKLEGTGRKQKGKSSGSSGFMRDSLECDEAFGRMVSSDELETNLLIQQDETAALKVALASTLQAKQQDLALYHEILDDTKQLFLRGLRQCRQGAPP